MTEVFLKIVNMSFSASWLVLAVLLVRLLMKRAPKWVHVLLWGMVALRLLCPVSIESVLSLIPSGEVISPDILLDRTPQITTGIPAVNAAINPILSESLSSSPGDSANTLQIWIPLLSALWLIGMAAMAAYTAVSYIRLQRAVRTATWLYGNIYQSARIPSPFLLGIVKPKIYLPYGLSEAEMAAVIAHEQAHIRRRDHWWKPLGFLLLTLHWFNPVVWVAYILLCRDIELACDEKVVDGLDRDQRADYSQALLECSVHRRMIAACPLAFGEVGVAERVRKVLSYKKPAFWIIVMALVLCAVIAVCFLTDPAPAREFAIDGNNVADLDPRGIITRLEEITGVTGGFLVQPGEHLSLTAGFDWAEPSAIPFSYSRRWLRTYLTGQLRLSCTEGRFYVTRPKLDADAGVVCLMESYLEALKYMPQAKIRAMSPDADLYTVRLVDIRTNQKGPSDYDRSIAYTKYEDGDFYAFSVHLELQPYHESDGAYAADAEEVIHLFYGRDEAEILTTVTQWVDFWNSDRYPDSNVPEMKHPRMEDTVFHYLPEEISVTDENGQSVLITGMPIWNAYFDDLTGDGKPELCATVSFGSGMIDTHVVVYDYANKQEYTLWDRGVYDYSLRLERGALVCDKKIYPDGAVVASGRLVLTDAGLTIQDMASAMVPTEANLHGIFDCYLYRTIDGETYRYERQDGIPAGLIRGEFLETVAEDDGTGIVCYWDVYAVAGCTDNTMFMAQCRVFPRTWLYTYSPSKRAEDGALEAARDAGAVIMEDGRLTGGQDVWEAFYDAATGGTPAAVTVAQYFTLDRTTTTAMAYEAYQEDYPALYITQLSYDGETYTLRDGERTQTFEYLMKYSGRNPAVISSETDEYTHYVLTHDNSVTWEQLWKGLISSASGAYIDHRTVVTERY